LSEARSAIEERPVVIDEAEPQRPVVRGVSTLVGDVASMFGSRLGSIVLSFLSVLITTRLLHPVGYGRVAYFTVVAMLVFTVTSGWTSTAVARYGREELEETGSLKLTHWSRVSIMAPLFCVAAVIVPLLKLAGAFPPEFDWTFVWLVVVYGGMIVAVEHVRYLLEASGRMRLSALGMIGQQAAFVVAVAAVAVTGAPRTPLMVIVLSLAALAIVAVVFGSSIWRIAVWPPATSRAARSRMLRFSLPLVAFTVSQYLIQAVDLIIIGLYKTAAEVGVYAFAYQAFTVVQTLAAVAPQILTPLFVSARTARSEGLVKRYFERVVPQITLIAAAAVGLTIPLLATVVPALFGEGFRGSVEPVAVLLVSILLLLMSNLLAPVIVLHERSRAVALLNAAAAVINVGGDVLLLGPLHAGIVAAAYATAAGFLVIAVGYFFVARGCLDSRVRLRLELLAPALLALAATTLLDGGAAIVVGLAASIASTLLLLVLGRVFTREDGEFLARLEMPAPLRRAALRVVRAVTR
jgi:O-antigen/teichoic acid export membrane protein